jgi:hypothetical protein
VKQKIVFQIAYYTAQKLATVGLKVVSLIIWTLKFGREQIGTSDSTSLTLRLALIFLVYLQLPQANYQKILEVKPHLLPARISSIDYVVGLYITLRIDSVGK